MEPLAPVSTDPLVARLARVRQAIAELNHRLEAPKRHEPAGTEPSRNADEVRRLQERLELMQAWAQDSEEKLRTASQQVQQALLSEEQRQRECHELRTLIRQQEERLRVREAEARELAEELLARRDHEESLRRRIEELEQALVGARQTVAEQGDLLRQSEAREAQLKRRLRDFKRAG